MMHSDPYEIDKRDICKSFNKAAMHYDRYTQLTDVIGDRLFERLDLMLLTPSIILDLGAATGNQARKLQAKFTQSKVLGLDIAWRMSAVAESQRKWLKKERFVCGDAERLPFADNSIDLIYSNLMLYWLSNPDQALIEINRVLKPGGLLMFTTYGPDTLNEMRRCFADSQNTVHVNRFMDMHDIGDGLNQAGFGGTVMDSEHITMTYENIDELHRDLKGLGESNINVGRQHGLTGKSSWKRYLDNYNGYLKEPQNPNNQLPATWEVIYGHAWAGEHQIPKGPHNIGRIGIKTL